MSETDKPGKFVDRGRKATQVFIVGGGTAVEAGWRTSTIDADPFSK